MRKFSPFLKSPKFEIAKVGNELTGYIYLMKKNGLSPCENPVDLQEASKRQAKVTALILEAIKNYAERHGLTEGEAREAMFAENNAVAINPVDYLPMEQKERYFEHVDQVKTLPYKAATLMLCYRAVYPVELVGNTKANSTVLQVNPIGFSAVVGDRIRFEGGVTVELTAKAIEGAETLAIKPLESNLSSGKMGFLIDFETGTEKYGFPDWSDKDTNECLLETQVQALFNFYKSEAGELPTDEEEVEASEEGKQSTSLLNPSVTSQPVPA